MAWRNSKATAKLLAQINAAYPGRDKSWDGTIGDTAHSKRKSEHNPNAAGVVRAIDITHDPKHGPPGDVLAEALRTGGDPRVAFVIWNKQIAGAGKGWNWRKYTGAAPHDHHVHLSVHQDPKLYDSGAAWKLPMLAAAKPVLLPEPKPAPVGERPLTEAEVRQMQDRLRELDFTTVGETDGRIGPLLKGALTQYCEANDVEYKDPPTIALLWHMQSTAAKRATPSPARRDASPKKVDEIAPEVKAAKDAGWLAAIQKAVLGVYTAAILPAAMYLKDNPEIVAALGVAGVVAILIVNVMLARRAQTAVDIGTAAVQDGDRFRSSDQ